MDDLRSLILLNEMGDLEINWTEESDERMRQIIAKKMAAGVRFFQMKTVLAGKIAYKKRLKNIEALAQTRLIIKDEDIDKAINDGEVTVERRSGAGEITVGPAITDPAQAARTRTVGVRQMQGG